MWEKIKRTRARKSLSQKYIEPCLAFWASKCLCPVGFHKEHHMLVKILSRVWLLWATGWTEYSDDFLALTQTDLFSFITHRASTPFHKCLARAVFYFLASASWNLWMMRARVTYLRSYKRTSESEICVEDS